jgi:predicted nucleic acid-binding protein
MLVRDQTARTQLGETWRQLPAQPTVEPRQDTNVEASAAAPPAPRITGASDMARNGLASVDQVELETAALNAYSLSLARFLGAQQNHDQAGMSHQAQLMLKFITMALEAAKSAARSRYLADQLILIELERRQARAKRMAGGWSVELPNLGRTSSTLPPEVVDELRRSGLETQGMAQLRHDLDALTPAEIDFEIAALRAQVKAESASANGPQPPDLANLERERLRAHELASSAAASPRSQ